ncbi:MAG: transposase [Fibrobacter sp.]|nr:transposase [Fibrobacter sp.]
MSKDRQIISELRNYFTENGCGLGIQRIMNVLGTINITEKQLAYEKKPNCKFTCAQIVQMMVLFPFFSIKNAANYFGSSLYSFFSCNKDMFYRVLSNDRIDWRRIIRYVNKKLVTAISVRSDARNSEYPVCLIADDTDMPKTGRKGEMLGRIYSHVAGRGSILGHKGLFLCRTDGRTQMLVDFTLQGEKGRVSTRPQGLSRKDIEKRFSKQRSADSKVEKRKSEYFLDKISNLKTMLNRVIIDRIDFEYLLVDSWFVCKEIVKYIRRKGSKSHLLGMIKMSKTKYTVAGEEMTANAIASVMVKKKAVKYSRAHKFYYFEVEAVFAGKPVKLFFYRFGNKGEWKALLSTDTSLTPYRAYQIYAMRWSIEVVFHETKSLLNLGKCQCRDFGSQIASISINMLQYNLLSYVKRFESYETIGGLFREITTQMVELSVIEKIWGIIQEIVSAIAEFLSADIDELLTNIIYENKKFKAMLGLVQRLQIAS